MKYSMKQAVFLDRDGTINVDHGFTYRVQEFEFLPGALAGLRRLTQDFELFIVTNQSGIARGLFNQTQLEAFHAKMLEETDRAGIEFKKIYVCPHHPDENCECRKPRAKFLLDAARDFGVSLKDSWMVGDRWSDLELANNAGCSSIFLFSGTLVQDLKRIKDLKPTYFAADLDKASRFICYQDDSKCIDRENIKEWARLVREQEKRIVTLNGSFDILHEGHIKIIREAKAQGDILLVALNSDSSVRKNKGEERPFNSEDKRALMMSAFPEVNAVTIFSDPTPIELLEDIRPSVHVNGSDYGVECIEAPIVRKYGGRIHIVELIPELSSTKMVNEKLKK
jgi:D-glycero-D-manno-heptose 1,7-bisphosphate phosphatase